MELKDHRSTSFSASTNRARVAIVDDDDSVRHGLDSLLRSVGYAVDSFASGDAFLAQATGPYQCAVVDVRMSGLDGLELQTRLTHAQNPIPLVFLTGHATVPISVRAMKAGAVDFLMKPFLEQELLSAIDRAIDVDAARRIIEQAGAEARHRVATLTKREAEVMSFVVRGYLNKQIAAELGVSEVMIKVHRAHMLRKMGAQSVIELVRISDRLRHGP